MKFLNTCLLWEKCKITETILLFFQKNYNKIAETDQSNVWNLVV